MLALVLSHLSFSCRIIPSPNGCESARIGPLLIESAPEMIEACGGPEPPELSYSPFSMIYPFLNGVLRKLELAHLLTSEEKLRFLQCCWSLPLSIEEQQSAAGHGQGPPLILRLPDYFERGDLLLRIEYRAASLGKPKHYVWRSNALANPATGAPLRGRGGYAEAGPLWNIGGSILLFPDKIVSASDLYSSSREQRLRAGGELLLLAHLYLFDELSSHTRWAKMLAESILSTEGQPRERRAGALCLLARLMLMDERYAEAETMLGKAEILCLGEPVYLSQLLHDVREEHRLAKALSLEYH